MALQVLLARKSAAAARQAAIGAAETAYKLGSPCVQSLVRFPIVMSRKCPVADATDERSLVRVIP
jgi:hypothetical protein